MVTGSIRIFAFILTLHVTGVLQAHSRPDPDGRLAAAVFMVRGSVSGSSAGEFGAFVRNSSSDTTWSKVTRSNIFTFGLGYFENGSTHRRYVAAGNGLHRSTDGGKSWKIVTSWRTMEVLSVAPDPVDSAVVTISTPWGIFQTTDDGGTWVEKMSGMRRWFVKTVLIHPQDRRTLYAAGEDDLYISSDRGDRWTPLNVGAAPVLAVHQMDTDPEVILAGVEEGGIRRTADGGRTWKAVRGMDSFSVYTITSSRDGRELYAAGWETGVWRSVDKGETWSLIWKDPAIECVFCLFVHPHNSQYLLAGTDGQGIFESRDGGVTWASAGLSGGKVKHIAFYPY